MPIAVTCTCGKRYQVADDLAGKLVYCPNCKLSLDIPAPGQAPTVEDIEVLDDEKEDTGPATYDVGAPVDDGGGSTAAAAASFGGALGVVKTSEREASCLAYSSGNRYVMAGIGRNVLVVDPKASKKLFRFEGHDDPVTALAFSPKADLALSGDRHGDMILWDLQTGRTMRRFRAHRGPVLRCAVAPNSRYAISGGEDGIVRLWDLNTGEDIPLLNAAWDEAVTALVYSHDGAHILAGGDRGRIALWNVRSGERLMKVRPSREAIESVAFSHDNTELAAAGFSQSSGNGLMAWRYQVAGAMHLPAFTNPSPTGGTIYCLALGPNGRKLFVGAAWKEITTYTGSGGDGSGYTRAAIIGGLVGVAIYSAVNSAGSSESEDHCGLLTFTVEGGIRGQKLSGVNYPVVEVVIAPDGMRAVGALEGGDLAFFALPP
jgi:WD40 repeat protein